MQQFDAKKETDKIIQFIRNYYQENNLEGAILGISGGKDSAVVAAIMTKALGKNNVIGLSLPCHSDTKDREDAKLISDCYGFKLMNFDITTVFDSFKNQVKNLGKFSEQEVEDSDINLKPRLRMSTLYYLAALYSNIHNKRYLVIGTSNKCELFVGYFTKGGDSVHDIAPIADFTVDEVIKIGEYLKVPSKVLYKSPSDGLSNRTDEEKLGVRYSEIASYIKDRNSISPSIAQKIEKLHQNNLHKFHIPTYRR